MPALPTTSLSPTELAYLRSGLASAVPSRPDARSPTTFRPLVAEVDFLPSTNGSARVCFADGTEGIVGVKAEVEPTSTIKHESYQILGEGPAIPRQYPSQRLKAQPSPAELVSAGSWLEVSIDMPGQRDDDPTVIFLGEMTREALLADGHLAQRLYINSRWHWKLYIDILLLSPPAAYPLPLISISTHLAILSARLPALTSQGDEDPTFDDDWDAAIPLYVAEPIDPGIKTENSETVTTKPPVTLLVVSVGDNIFFDPSREELAVADAVLAVTISYSMTSTPQNTEHIGNEPAPPRSQIKVLAVRSIDPPSRATSSSSAALGGEPGFNESADDGESSWRPRKGGIQRKVVLSAVRQCVKEHGVGHEVLTGLEGFV